MIGIRAAPASVILLMLLNLSIASATTNVTFQNGDYIIDMTSFPYTQATGQNCSFIVNKTTLNQTAAQGDNVSFIINITNTGDVDLTRVRVVDVLPIGLVYRWDNSTPNGVASGNVVTWEDVGPLAVRASKFIKLWAEVVLRGI